MIPIGATLYDRALKSEGFSVVRSGTDNSATNVNGDKVITFDAVAGTYVPIAQARSTSPIKCSVYAVSATSITVRVWGAGTTPIVGAVSVDWVIIQ
jgi:hypothetical protein